MALNTETVWIGRDNAIDLQMKDDSATAGTIAATDLSSATKVEIVIDGETAYNSSDNPTVVTYTSEGVVTLTLGSVITGGGSYELEIIVYDNTNTNGVAWEPKVSIEAQTSVPA